MRCSENREGLKYSEISLTSTVILYSEETTTFPSTLKTSVGVCYQGMCVCVLDTDVYPTDLMFFGQPDNKYVFTF